MKSILWYCLVLGIFLRISQATLKHGRRTATSRTAGRKDSIFGAGTSKPSGSPSWHARGQEERRNQKEKTSTDAIPNNIPTQPSSALQQKTSAVAWPFKDEQKVVPPIMNTAVSLQPSHTIHVQEPIPVGNLIPIEEGKDTRPFEMHIHTAGFPGQPVPQVTMGSVPLETKIHDGSPVRMPPLQIPAATSPMLRQQVAFRGRPQQVRLAKFPDEFRGLWATDHTLIPNAHLRVSGGQEIATDLAKMPTEMQEYHSSYFARLPARNGGKLAAKTEGSPDSGAPAGFNQVGVLQYGVLPARPAGAEQQATSLAGLASRMISRAEDGQELLTDPAGLGGQQQGGQGGVSLGEQRKQGEGASGLIKGGSGGGVVSPEFLDDFLDDEQSEATHQDPDSFGVAGAS